MQRVITAVVIVGCLLAALLLLPPLGLTLFFAAIVLTGGWEWSNFAELRGAGRIAYVLLVAALMVAVAWLCGLHFAAAADVEMVKQVLRAGALWWSLALLWVMSYPRSALIWRPRPIRAVLGLFTLIPAWLAVSYLRLLDGGVGLIVLAVALVAIADIAAYFTGRAWGRAKLAPEVSPGKSWAGFWGGFVASVGSALLAYLLWPGEWPIGLLPMLVIAAFTALASVLGDLVESMFKRERGIKDSGAILPGHGGVMDRLDGMSAALPVFALGIVLAGW